MNCGNCGEPLVGSQRKWCSERCRKTKYAGHCEVCGTATTGTNGASRAPTRCQAHNPSSERERARANRRMGAKRQRVIALIKAGHTDAEIAARVGTTRGSVRTFIHRLRTYGYDIPVRRTFPPRAAHVWRHRLD